MSVYYKNKGVKPTEYRENINNNNKKSYSNNGSRSNKTYVKSVVQNNPLKINQARCIHENVT